MKKTLFTSNEPVAGKLFRRGKKIIKNDEMSIVVFFIYFFSNASDGGPFV